MIDWVTAVLPCLHDPEKLRAGLVACLDASGDVQWTVEKALQVEGSYSSKIHVRSHTDRTIWISGNPAKFLQGHNVFGTDDLRYLMARFFDSLLQHDALGLCPTADDYDRVRAGQYFLSRVDVNQSWMLPDRAAVLAWIRAAGSTCRLKRRGAGQYTGDTLYFGKTSRRWAVKCYSKGQDITRKGNELHKDLQYPELMDFAEKALRIELVIRSMGLKNLHLDYAAHWTPDTAKQLLCSLVLDGLEISDNMPAPDQVLDALPYRLRLVYQSWKNGDDLRQMLPKNTFYRHRRALLQYGIDIAIPQQADRNNVIPLIRYLEAQPAAIPQWAYDKGLVA